MKTIWKFPLLITDRQEIVMPAGAHIVSAASQDDTLCIWALVDPDKPLCWRTILIHGTGHPVSERAIRFIGTVLMNGGRLVWHVAEFEA